MQQSFGAFEQRVNGQMQNMHLELVRQFHIQQASFESSLRINAEQTRQVKKRSIAYKDAPLCVDS